MLDKLKKRLLIRLAMTKNSHAYTEEQITVKEAKVYELEKVIKMIEEIENEN